MSQSPHQTADAPALGARENFWGDVADDTDEEPESDHLDDCSHSKLVEITRQQCDVENPTGSTDELKALIRAARDDKSDDKPEPCYSSETIAEWKAHKILRQAADKHSPIAKHAPPYVCPISDEIEAARLSTLTAWLFDGDVDPDRVERSDRTALHRENTVVEMTDPLIHVPRESEGIRFGIREFGQFRLRSRYDPEHGYISGLTLGDQPTGQFMEIVEIVLQNAKSTFSFADEKLDEWRRDARRLKSFPDKSDQDVLATILKEMFEQADH
jgi:hypothetical protein